MGVLARCMQRPPLGAPWTRLASVATRATGRASPPPHLFDKVLAHAQRPALFEPHPWTYSQLLHEAVQLRDRIQQSLPASAGKNPRIAYLGSRGASYVAMQWATWLADGVTVPLHAAHPVEELQYIVEDSQASVVVVSDEYINGEPTASTSQFLRDVQAHGKAAVVLHNRPVQGNARVTEDSEASVRKWIAETDFESLGAQIVYTSGTTGRPKGVVSTHAGLTAQIDDVVRAWEMTERDHLLHFLPLHHVHGILNNLLCVHYAGGSLEFLGSAKSDVIWRKLAESLSDTGKKPVSMLMAVPTVYMNLLDEIERDPATKLFDKQAAIEAVRKLRVAISGSMACPVSILNRWEDLTGHRLLERYGMTELGMALTNPLHGERHLGFVGGPFPSVSVRLVDPDTERELPLGSGEEGELRVRGPTVFKEYWRKPEATAKEFDDDGWFKTGDIAQYDVSKKSFRIRGRASADIIKSGGYKISALDIERVLLTHPEVPECAVFGIPDEKWGQVVAAVVRVSGAVDNKSLAQKLTGFCKEHLADYRVPRKFFFVEEIPKNAMGKVNKKSLGVAFGTKQAAS